MQATVDFHEDVDVTQWLLYTNHAAWAGRGLTQGAGHVFTREGHLVALLQVQSMIRPLAWVGDADAGDLARTPDQGPCSDGAGSDSYRLERRRHSLSPGGVICTLACTPPAPVLGTPTAATVVFPASTWSVWPVT